MHDVMEKTVYLEEFEGELPEARFVSSDYFGLSGLNGSLVPVDGRFPKAHYSARVDLSQDSFDDEIRVSDGEAVITGQFECVALSSETWFEIRTDQFEWTGEHTRNREDVPGWAAEEGTEGYIRVRITFDPELTVEERTLTRDDFERKREQTPEFFFE